ncbi:MAG: hypothetical protein Q9178_004870 [Gyalolechia marmorata]
MSPKWSSSPLLFALSTCFLFVSSVLGKCECGYSVKGQGTYTNAFEADFFHQDDIAHDEDWFISDYNQAPNSDQKPMTYEPGNVISNPLARSSGDPGLQLFVRGYKATDASVRAAELITKREDMQYGSYRAAIKYTTVPGTCGSIFWLKNGPYDRNTVQEIDVELLSYEDTDASPQRKIHVVLHGPSGSVHDARQVPFRPSDGYHEYRFDWSPGKVSYYVDGQHIHDLTEHVPTVPGRIILNHWARGQDGWEKYPPGQDALMTVGYVKAYFNTTSPATKCVDPEANGAVCEVPAQLGPVSPEQSTAFLTRDGLGTYNTNEPAAPVNSPSPRSENISPENRLAMVIGTFVVLPPLYMPNLQ